MLNPPPSQIDPEERISRFIFNKSRFRKGNGRILPEAFMPTNPMPDRPERETSVYRTENCNESEVWWLGEEFVTKLHTQKLPILARCDLKLKEILLTELEVVPAVHPHNRHANIVGWPEEKECQKMKAVMLADKAQLVVK